MASHASEPAVDCRAASAPHRSEYTSESTSSKSTGQPLRRKLPLEILARVAQFCDWIDRSNLLQSCKRAYYVLAPDLLFSSLEIANDIHLLRLTQETENAEDECGSLPADQLDPSAENHLGGPVKQPAAIRKRLARVKHFTLLSPIHLSPFSFPWILVLLRHVQAATQTGLPLFPNLVSATLSFASSSNLSNSSYSYTDATATAISHWNRFNELPAADSCFLSTVKHLRVRLNCTETRAHVTSPLVYLGLQDVQTTFLSMYSDIPLRDHARTSPLGATSSRPALTDWRPD